MRCKRHTVDFSSTIGVCASCLRERLLPLAASAAATAAVEDTHHHQSWKCNNNSRFIAPAQVDFETNRISKSKEGKCVSNLFRTRSEEFNNSNSRFSSDASCVSTIISSVHRKKQSAIKRKPQWIFCGGKSENRNELSSETMVRLRKPLATTRMGFRLSLLVRANHQNCSSLQRKIISGNSGGKIESEKPRISETASFCTNRSKKLVDLGRVDRHR